MNHSRTLPLAGVLLLGAGVSATAQTIEPPPDIALDATNRVTLSLRYGLNIHSRFAGVGLAGGSGRYYDGYVLRDSTGNFLGYTSYWGYDHASQYDSGANTFSYHNPVDPAYAAGSAGDADGYPGVELSYDHQLGVKEDWHRLRYGLEGAANYLSVSLKNDSANRTAVATDVYTFGGIPGQVPPPGYRGGYSGNPGDPVMVAGATPGANTTGILRSHDEFDADLFGFRLGPYVELPFGKKEQFTLALSGGLALGLLNAHEEWRQNLTLSGGDRSPTFSGSGNDFHVLWGWYVGASADYQINKRWGAALGVQYQDLGTYRHAFSGRQVELDLRQSVFLTLGVSYSF